MTIEFTQPGDVAAQVYNQAKCDGATDEQATEVAWAAMQHAKSSEPEEEETED